MGSVPENVGGLQFTFRSPIPGVLTETLVGGPGGISTLAGMICVIEDKATGPYSLEL
jgi:hypothetical protein